MDVDFVIPLSTDDLLNGEPGCYVVEEVFSCRSLPNKLADCFVDLRSQGPCTIIETFDAYFSLLRHFNDVENALRDEALQILLKAFKQLVNDISPMVEQGDSDPETRKRHLTALKMMCYLLVQLASLYESDATKPTTQVSAPKGRGKSGAASKKKTTGSFDWDSERDRVIELLGHMLQLEVNRLWDPPIVEEEFVNLITGFCYKLLENPVVTRTKTTKDLVFNLLGTVVKKYSTGLSTSLKIVQLIQHFEQLVPHLSQAVDLIATEFGVKSIVAEIIREIGMMNPADLAKDTSGTRAYADFIVDLTSRIPSLVLNNISLLICHLDGESYSMRNGVLGAMGEIVLKVLSSGELDDNAKNLRDQFLDKLEAHLHDTNAYVRSKALQIWLQLCNNMAIPLPRQQHLLELLIGRLHDKSTSVRKYAIQLLKCFLVNNPFGAKLPLDHLKEKLSIEMEKLKEMAPHLTQQSDNQVPVLLACADETWKAIEPEVKATIEEHIAQENDEEEETEESAPEAFELALKEIKQLIDKGHHKKALLMLKKTQRKWPDEAILCADTVTQGNLFDEENESEEDGKNKMVAEKLSILKAIFLASDEETPQESVPQEGELNPEALLDAANQNTDENGETNNNGLVNEISKQQLVVQYLQDYVNFQTQMEKTVPVICQLLGSKTISDVSESIEFFVTAYEFGLRNAIFGVRRMLVLIWSRDTAVKDSVVEAYKGLYLDPTGSNQRTKTALIVKNMIALTQGASIGDLTSLEELMSELMKGKLIPGPVIKLLWEKFTMKVSQTTAEESRAALILIGMLASAEMDVIRSNTDVLVKTGLGTRAEEDFLLARDTCVALLKLKKTKTSRSSTDEPFRFPSSHVIFERLTQIIVAGIRRIEDPHWIPMAEQAINVIYALSEHPDTICEEIIRKLAACLIDKEIRQSPIPEDGQDTQTQDDENGPQNGVVAMKSCHSTMLARLLHLSGHVALRQLIHMDSSILKEIKRRQCVQENEKEKERQNKQAGKGKSSNNTTTATNTTKDTTTNETAEEEMGLTGATSDDVETEYIRNICEQDIVTGQNLLALLRPLLVFVCSNPTKFKDPSLQAAAALALAKFMLVSSQFCDAHLQLLFTILEKSPQETIRANTIIAVGDLTFRFPNLLEPWTSHLYARLRDDSPHVRKNTMMVLTHLILNDMVKVKGNISEMATCLEDKDKRIADLAKLFFLELSKKGNAVYNVLPDIISRLSDPDCGIEEEPFRNILRYMLSFIQKDRQSESLVEKLCHRFRATRCDRQWRDLAFCLSLLPYNERAIRKLNENFGCFHDKLSDEDVHQSFMTIVGKSKKFAKIELKTLVEELEQRIEECHTKGMDDEAGYERASKASGAASKTKKSVSATPSGKSTRSRKGVTPAARRRKKTVNDDSDSDEEPATASKKTACTPRNPRVRPPKSAKKQSTKKRKQLPSFESEDDDDDVELFDLDEEDEDDGGISDDENAEPVQENAKNKRSKNTKKNMANGSTSTAKNRSIRT